MGNWFRNDMGEILSQNIFGIRMHEFERGLRGPFLLSAVLVLLLVLSGCMSNTRTAYNATEASDAQVTGFGDIRTYLDAGPLELGDAYNWRPAKTGKQLNYLVISGGGSGGAFSVGVLAAWTKSGARPQFDVVSGVSTGALIAPFAFLGSSYDDFLIKLYTSGIAKDLIDRRWLPNTLLGPSVMRQEPLRLMVEQYVTRDVLQAVAIEHGKGRRLLVLTSNLDSQRAVVWNMGAIATSGQPGALKLFQDVLIASASIPGIFPAVMIKTNVNGRAFEEMHSDGGSASQLLTMPDVLLADPKASPSLSGKNLNIYAIVNNALMPEFSNTTDRTLPVMARAYATLVKSQTRSSLMALYGYAARTGAIFHATWIDKQFSYTVSDPFNATYMRSVFNLGYSETLTGTLWKAKPL